MTRLLPSKLEGASAFTDPTYWKNFFAQRKSPFEWYGDYQVLSTVFDKYIRPSDQILQIGCGNSALASQLYDNGYQHIHSIDTDSRVIRDQKLRNRVRTGLVFEEGDATALKHADESFNVVVDKGTLDALLPPDPSDVNKSVVSHMFSEVARVLAANGRYIIITLAQEHIINFWVEQLRSRFFLRVHKGTDHDTEFRMPVFVLVATKLRHPMEMPLEFSKSSDAKMDRVPSVGKLYELIRAQQEFGQFMFHCHQQLPEEVSVILHDNENNPKYKVFLVDKDAKEGPLESYAIFIVPLGRDCDWIFGTERGRRVLRMQCKADRLAVVHLYRHMEYPCMETVKQELNHYATTWAPGNLTGEFQYLSMGATDVRKSVASGKSEINGEWSVEEVDVNDEVLRRLVFSSSQNLIQTEAKMKPAKKGKRVMSFDELAAEYQELMLLSLCFHPEKPILRLDTAELKVAILGLGGGLLTTFLIQNTKQLSCVSIELDPVVVKIAKEHFGLPHKDPRLEVRVMDALDYLHEAAVADEANKLDILFVDLAGAMDDSGLSCPPIAFVEDDVLLNMRNCLKPNGVLALNLVTRDEAISHDIKARVAHYYSDVFRVTSTDDINEVLICLPNTLPTRFDHEQMAAEIKDTAPSTPLTKAVLSQLTHLNKYISISPEGPN
ncbi:unnamed protein product, partial [Mesorhabditis spiculigera]